MTKISTICIAKYHHFSESLRCGFQKINPPQFSQSQNICTAQKLADFARLAQHEQAEGCKVYAEGDYSYLLTLDPEPSWACREHQFFCNIERALSDTAE